MRKRFQKPRIINQEGYWIAQFRDLKGKKRKVSLGPTAKTQKVDAELKLARLLQPINDPTPEQTIQPAFGAFVRQVYLPFYKRKWKRSTIESNEGRIQFHLMKRFENQPLSSFSRNQLQDYLDEKAANGLSRNVVAHLRWDLKQILRMAVAEGYLLRNPAELLFIPRAARTFPTRWLAIDEVRLLFSVLNLRERVIAGLALLAGMRPGEIFALRRCHLECGYADIQQRIYRGLIDTPKTSNSMRWAGLGDGQSGWLREWLDSLPSTEPEAWVFPSERGTTPISKDNCWRRYFLPRLKTVGLEWANFQVMRRTHSSLLNDLGVDPQVRADQMGHTVDVNQNKYTRSSLQRRQQAVNQLEKAIGVA